MTNEAGEVVDTASVEGVEAVDRRRQILEAALRVFSTKGFQRATNKDIAKEAGGISPGLIYHYFKHKEDLLFTIVRERAIFVQVIDQSQELMNRPIREVLILIGRGYLETLAAPHNVALFRIVIGEAFRYPEISESMYRMVIGPIYGIFVRYIQSQVDGGVLRPCDPGVAVRSFMGMFVAHVLLRELFQQPEARAVDNEAVVRQVVETFLYGLSAGAVSPGA